MTAIVYKSPFYEIDKINASCAFKGWNLFW